MNDLLYLLACALHDEKPQEIENLDLEAIKRLAKFHSVTPMIAYAMRGQGEEWQRIYLGNVKRNMLFKSEREKLYSFFEDHRIAYMPLKGVRIMDMYPAYGMRKMADNDIWIDKKHATEARDYMIGEGYECISFGKSNHDVYHKKPIFNFELHTSLYGETHSKEFYEYYKDIDARLRKDNDSECRMRMRDDDFYVYVCSHAYKHFNNSGTGVRTLCDDYVLRHNLSLDMDYVHGEAKKLKIDGFVMQMQRLSEGLFADPENICVTEEDKEFLSYILGSGTYGTVNHMVERQLRMMSENVTPITKARYVCQRIFPGDEYFKAFPFFERHRGLRPFFIVYRIGKSLVKRNKNMVAELKAVVKA